MLRNFSALPSFSGSLAPQVCLQAALVVGVSLVGPLPLVLALEGANCLVSGPPTSVAYDLICGPSRGPSCIALLTDGPK